ncbi:EcoAI/FtnUII family type I restriction enzme subunit R [Streptococcus rifensis]
MVKFIKQKKNMSEEDIKANFITPAILAKGWKNGEHIAYEEYFTDGRIEVRGDKARRKEGKKSDYALFYQFGQRIAIVEAKDNKHSLRSGLQQAIEYGEILDVPFVYTSNGDGFIEHDRITRQERELALEEFPTREELFERLKTEKKLNKEVAEAVAIPYYTDAFSSKTPRYYQEIAINRTIESVARGQKRVMFVMATGTGKTFMAFQIIHRLRKAGLAKRVLFLADRNVLVDQTMAEDFKPFEKVMTKITAKLLNSPEKLNSFEIYLGLYQQLTGEDGDETYYQKFDKDFFDLIVIDEAHRGSAKEDSNWRKVIDYFSSATQIGMTATPKETKEVSNMDYFGEPIYTYSLKQGIEDGFLAPYRVMRVNLDVDVDGYRPESGKLDASGKLIEDRYYGRKDFDKTIVIDDRTQMVAKFVSDYMKQNNARFDKTIVFCVDIDHAERMRAAFIKENPDLVQEDYRYVMQVTGDNAEGKAQLDNFMDVNSKYPAIVTTSKLLTTGVNAKTCRLIVLDSNIQSMTEFKQIIGRGTRLYPQKGKEFFTIIDFRNVTNLFADPDFDGEPVKILETDIKVNHRKVPFFVNEDGSPTEKYRVKDKKVDILNSTIQVLDENGELVTESLIDYTRKNVLGTYATLTDFITAWRSADKKKVILEELYKKGVYLDAIREAEGISEQEIDDFDLLLKLAYGQKSLTKSERISKVKQSGYLYKYSQEARAVLEILLDKYMDKGIGELESLETLKLPEFQVYGGTFKIINTYFGDKKRYLEAIKELEEELFTVA